MKSLALTDSISSHHTISNLCEQILWPLQYFQPLRLMLPSGPCDAASELSAHFPLGHCHNHSQGYRTATTSTPIPISTSSTALYLYSLKKMVSNMLIAEVVPCVLVVGHPFSRTGRGCTVVMVIPA